MNGAGILLIEDEPHVLRSNRIALELEGYRVLEADTLAKGREIAVRENPDLILLDILLPDGNGLEYCLELRGGSGVPILFLSALSEKEDVIAGLRAGGDDYITKPYLMEELLARVGALLRRGRMNAAAEQSIRLGGLEIHVSSRRACLEGKDLLLKPKEFALLEALASERDKYMTADALYEKLWGMDAAGDTDTVKVHVSKLRKKLGNNAPVTIDQAWGKGYRLVIKHEVIKI